MSEEKKETESFITEDAIDSLLADFSRTYKTKKHTDVVLKVGSYSFVGHKVILSSRSHFFDDLFDKEKGKEIDLSKYIETSHLDHSSLDIIFEYLYSGSLRINSSNVLDVYGLCTNMKLVSAEKVCNTFIDKMIDSSSVCGLLLAALERKRDSLVKTCMRAIEDNTEEAMDSEEYLLLTEEMIVSLLKNENLSCTEKVLFEGILRWWCANKDEVHPGNKEEQDKYLMDKLLYFIRYPLMSPEELEEIEKMKLIPEDYIMDALRHHACCEYDSSDLDEGSTKTSEDIYKDGSFRTKTRGESVGFNWNMKKAGGDLVIKDGHVSIDKININKYQIVLGTKGFDHGVHFWECDIVSATSTSHIMIGVCLGNVYLDQWVGQDKNGWSWFGYNGTKYNSGKSPSYANNTKFAKGDVVGVKLDLRKDGVLSFYKNGTPLGSAFTGLKTEIGKGKKLFPAVSLRTTGDKVLLRTKKLKQSNAYKKYITSVDK